MKINDLGFDLLSESTHDNFKFKKIGIDKFKTFVEVRGKKYPVEVYKNGSTWIASYFNGAMIKRGDTKRFATLEIRNAMRRDRTFFESASTYDNWTMPDTKTMRSDFEEYKFKEDTKWSKRAGKFGFTFPLFDEFEDYVDALKNARIITIDESNEDTIANLSDAESIEEIKSMVSEYYVPRDVERIVTGMEENHRIPYPVVLQGSNGKHIMSGNTRNNVARVLGATQKALLVDISE